MNEDKYKLLFASYLSEKITTEIFIGQFMTLWKDDRDTNRQHDPRFQRMIDRIFTSCDCWSENPVGSIEIGTAELLHEVGLLNHIWFNA